MKTCIAYYSKQGNTRLAAEMLAKKLKADLIELTEKTNYNGMIGFMRGGFRAVTGKLAKLDEETLKKITGYDTVLAASPVWAGKTTPAVNALLVKADLAGKKVYVLTTQADRALDGHDSRTAAIKEKLAAAGAVFGGCFSVYGAAPGKGVLPKAELEKQLEFVKID